MAKPSPLESFLEHLRDLPYVKQASLKTASPPFDGLLAVRTPSGTFSMAVEVKRTYFDRAMTNALIALATRSKEHPLIVFARYIPRPTGERLAAAGINFVDAPGNLHLRLGKNYHTLILGKQEDRNEPQNRRIGPGAVQVLFAFLAWPDAVGRPVRRLAELSGVGKTAAAETRQRLLGEGILRRQGGDWHLIDPKRIEEQFLEGYSRVLRPHLQLGRFRSRDRDPESFVERCAAVLGREHLPWALTGTAGAYELERFYRGEQTTVFLPNLAKDLQHRLALLPDRSGPIIFLRLFSAHLLWTGQTRRPVAHPWLLYAELLQESEPRAVEAANEIRDKYLAA